MGVGSNSLSLALVALSVALSAGAASAQLSNNHDPIDIHADKGDGFNPDCHGVYLDHVDVVQGDGHLKADKLTIFYYSLPAETPPAGQTSQPSPSKPAGAASPNKPTGQASQNKQSSRCGNIKELIAEGNVYYSTTDGKIHGDKADYVAEADTVTVTGLQVVLTRNDGGVSMGKKVV